MVKTGMWKELLFPRRCVVCDDIADRPGESVCRECVKKIVYVKDPCCMKCGKELQSKDKEFCDDCMRRNHKFTGGAALYDYGSVGGGMQYFR